MTDRPERDLTAVEAQKIALRDRISTQRRRRPLSELRETAEALAAHLLASSAVRDAATVAAYVSVGSEPGTGPLLEALAHRGTRVLLPVVQPDLDLDWALHDGRLVRASMGLLEPAGPRLGPDAVASADAVLVPGLAVDRSGLRMGRGGGCYDRALSRVTPGTFVCALLFEDELVDAVPAAPHDRSVSAVATPAGITLLPAAPR